MEIWQEIRHDSERGARRLVAEYGDRLFAAAASLCRNDADAEDLVFRTFERAVRKIRLFDDRYGFYNWLYAILLNLYRMDLRVKRPDVVLLGGTEDLPDVPFDAFGALVERSGDDALTSAVRALSAPLREVVLLKYFADRSVEEIASILGLPTGTVKSRLHNARTALYGRLSKEAGGDTKK
ncbi:MAG: sigma-70 family RNA polymerase sigma factor, partial [Kiritimatiellae bacterium]|nr:sigma-70 family RNA polymerase sigma factor [Kiritimatiellia bacterium]